MISFEKHLHRYYLLPDGTLLVTRMVSCGTGPLKEAAWTRKCSFEEKYFLDLDQFPEREMSEEEARKLFGEEWFQGLCMTSPGEDLERLKKLADLGDKEARKCLKRMKLRRR